MIPKAKGTAVLGFVRFLRLNRERALEALAPSLHRYLDERILAASWYPESDFLALLKAQARILDTPPSEVFEQMGAVGARYDMTGVYKNLLKPGDPASTLRQGAGLWRNYHDTGEIHPVVVGPRRMRVELRGYGVKDRDLCRLNTGYFAEGVRLAGAIEVDVRHVECTSRGDPNCSWDARWAMAGETLER